MYFINTCQNITPPDQFKVLLLAVDPNIILDCNNKLFNQREGQFKDYGKAQELVLNGLLGELVFLRNACKKSYFI